MVKAIMKLGYKTRFVIDDKEFDIMQACKYLMHEAGFETMEDCATYLSALKKACKK